MKEIKAAWNVIVPVDAAEDGRTSSTSVTSSPDTAGRQSDGPSRQRHQKIINIIKTGYAVHISRLSNSAAVHHRP